MPDEFILGYLGRIGEVNGIRSGSDLRKALRQWYGQRQQSSPDNTLIEHLAFASGTDTYHFACYHTLIPICRAVSSYLNDRKHGDPDNFGLLSAHAPRLLRNDIQICPDCIQEDIEYLGYSFWRRSHQLPGIDWCLKHSSALRSVAGKQSDLLKQPSVVLKNLEEDERRLDQTTEENPIISRYAELVQVVLDFKSPIAPEAISLLLAEKARQKGLRITPEGSRTVLSDLMSEQLPSAWMNKHFPLLLQKKKGEFLYEYDGVCKRSGKAHVSTSYILATAMLIHTVQEGQKLLLDALQAPPYNKKSNSTVKPFPLRRIKSAYVASSGNIKHMANLMQSKYKSLLVTTKSKGLPALSDATVETLVALQDFYDKKAPLQEILMRPGIQVATVSEILRTAATPHAKLLSDIVQNYRKKSQPSGTTTFM